MHRLTLRARLTLVHTGLFLAASTLVVTYLYFANRATIRELEQRVTPRMYDTGQGLVPPQPTSSEQAWDDALAGLLGQSVLMFLLLGAVAGALGWWLTGRVLGRVHRMTAKARAISTANLHERIGLTGPQDELKELADTFDDLLIRVDEAFRVQGRFIANASHELRTPLTVTRTLLQVGLSSEDPDRVRRAREELLRSNDRSIALINGLLHLARGEQELRQREPVRLDAVVTRVARETDVSAADISVEPCEVPGDELLLEQVVRNLLDNAKRYNVPGGEVIVRVAGGELVVENTGEVVTDAEELFEPFHRGARQRTGPDGAGLGLSIVRAIVVAHGGRVHAKPREGGGLVVTVELVRGRTKEKQGC